jgi:hypothetical protein
LAIDNRIGDVYYFGEDVMLTGTVGYDSTSR